MAIQLIRMLTMLIVIGAAVTVRADDRFSFVEFGVHRGSVDYLETEVDTPPVGVPTTSYFPDYFHTEGIAVLLSASLSESVYAKIRTEGGELTDGCACGTAYNTLFAVGYHRHWFEGSEVYAELGFENLDLNGSGDGLVLGAGLRYLAFDRLEFEASVAASNTDATFFDGSMRTGVAVHWRITDRFGIVARSDRTSWGAAGVLIPDVDPGPGVTTRSTQIEHDVSGWSLGLRYAF